MYTLAAAYYGLKDALAPLYDERESSAIAHDVLETVTGLSKTDRLILKNNLLSPKQQSEYDKVVTQLVTGVPMQYALGHAWFMGNNYEVNNAVLIPRPETEELVQWIADDCIVNNKSISVLDVGTGSGCIAISLSIFIRDMQVIACDISKEALQVANSNAVNIGANVVFKQVDFLKWQEIEWESGYDIIVSNPPYIPLSIKNKLHENVINHEPHLALFVPDSDPLIFYRAIAAFGNSHLSEGGSIYCELDADNAMATKVMFEAAGYTKVVIKQDMHGNLRMLKAMK